MNDALLLIDLGSVYWAGWFATKSQMDAYTLALDTIERAVRDHRWSIVCCDSPQNWRHGLTADMPAEQRYKANRDAKPPAALEALRDVQERVQSWGIPVVLCDGYEADDVIATLTEQALAYQVHILSEDKDLYQLIDEHCFVLTKTGVRDVEGCRKKFGVPPELMGDLLTLCGDSSDNVQGCPGVGVGKAGALLNHFGGLDAVLGAPEKELSAVKGIGKTLVTNLREWDPSLARQLVRLATDAPVSLSDLMASMNAEPEDDPVPLEGDMDLG